MQKMPLIRLAIRHLPPTATVESVTQQLELTGIQVKRDHVKVQRVIQGKAATRTKQETPSVAFIEVQDEATGARIARFLETKDTPTKVELAFIQRAPNRTYSAHAKIPGTENVNAETWQQDNEYLSYVESLKPKPKSPGEDAANVTVAEGQEATAKVAEVAPLLAHMRKELQTRRNQSQKAKKDARKRKAPAVKASSAKKGDKPEKGENPEKGEKREKKGASSKASAKQAAE